MILEAENVTKQYQTNPNQLCTFADITYFKRGRTRYFNR